MQCESCQEREASVALTIVSGDRKRSLRLCPRCARKQSGDPPKGSPPKAAAKVKKINIVLGHLDDESQDAKCPECGLTYERFRKIGRLGCPACYAAFGEPLRRLLRRIHGADAHLGRGAGPGEASAAAEPQEEQQEQQEQLEQLRRELRQAVQEEAYERAAEIRDRIARRSGS